MSSSLGITTSGSTTPLRVRPFRPDDQDAVLELIAADRVPGQPRPTPQMLDEALAGRSPFDGSWWEELEPPVTEVAHDRRGVLRGVVSSARRPRDGAGVILWLHCREDPTVAGFLISHVLARLGSGTVHAFEFASALGLGLEALPVRHRPVTRRALEDTGFTGHDLWRYMRAELPITGLPHLTDYTVSDCEEGRRIEVVRAGETVAEAVIGDPVARIGLLWWISVEPHARRKGLGLALLGTALHLLTDSGAHEVILYVDDDAPGDPARDRTAANRLYERAGFVEVDRLFSFTRDPRGV